MYYIQVSLKRGLVAPWIAVRANGYPAPAHPLPLSHIRRRGEAGSNAIDYGEIAVAVIGVIIAALGVFKGWKCWKNRRSSKKRVRVFRSYFLWRWRWSCANSGRKTRTYSQSLSIISSPTEDLPVVPRPLGRTGGNRQSDLVVTVELHVQPSQSSLPPQLHLLVRWLSPLQLPPPPTRSRTLPTMASDPIARPNSALQRVSNSRTARQ